MTRRAPFLPALVGVLLLVCAPYTHGQSLRKYRYDVDPAIYTKGEMITQNTVSFEADPDIIPTNNYEIHPDLNATTGLTFDATTGTISGTPTRVVGLTTFVVDNQCLINSVIENCPTRITIAVNDARPNVSMSSVATATSGTAFASSTPVNVGGAATAWSIVPPLPSGFYIDSAGVIRGMSTEETDPARYQVTATNSGGSDSAIITFRVDNPVSTTLNEQVLANTNELASIREDTDTAVSVSYVALTAVFLFAIGGLLIFIAWRQREKNPPPPMLISDAALEKLSRRMGNNTLDEMSTSASRGRRPSLVSMSGSGDTYTFGTTTTTTAGLARRPFNIAQAHSKSRQSIRQQPSMRDLAQVAKRDATEADSQRRQAAVAQANTPAEIFAALGVTKHTTKLLNVLGPDADIDFLVEQLTEEDVDAYVRNPTARSRVKEYLRQARSEE